MDNIFEIIVFIIFFIISVVSSMKKKEKEQPLPGMPQRRPERNKPPQRSAPKEYTTYTSTQKHSETAGSSDAYAELEALFGWGTTPRSESKPTYTSKAKDPSRESDFQPFEETVKQSNYQEFKSKDPLIKADQNVESIYTMSYEDLPAPAAEPLSLEELSRQFEQTEANALVREHAAADAQATYSRSRGLIDKLKNRETFRDAVIMSEILKKRGANWKRA